MSAQRENLASDVLIIGGGLSGAMLAAQLLRQPGRRRVLIVEPRRELGRGEAYSATHLGHTLNGNAARMSVDPDNADDLTAWLGHFVAAGGWPESAEQQVPVAELFPPRGLFGVYARQRLAEAEAIGSQQGSKLEHVQAEALDLTADEQGVSVSLADGRILRATRAVLATGMFAAARTTRLSDNALNTAAVDPWDIQAMQSIDADGRVIIIGSGLTMVDAVVSLQAAGHRGLIEVFSRHGLLPHERRQPPAWEDFLATDPTLRSPLQLLRALRGQCRTAQQQGIDWQAPLDTVRVHIARLWSQASERHKRQFVRHVRPWWESHHHRSPPQGAALLARLVEEGRLRIHAASLQGVETGVDGQPVVTLRFRGQAQVERLTAAALINSTGIEYDWRRVARSLPQNLLQRRLVQPGPLALGIAADEGGAVLDAEGQVSRRLFAMGPPLRGLWWESTAVTDVALQAKALALRLAGAGD